MPDVQRKLATVRLVQAIEPIPNADNIVKAVVDGWELVTQKSNNFHPSDLVIFFEIDSFLPVREEFEFLRKSGFKSTTNLGDGFRLKTIKLKGQVSQGLILPLNDFFEKDDRGYFVIAPIYGDTKIYLEEGMDLTEYFGVQKYEKPVPTGHGSKRGPMHARGNFPSFLRKTDEERVQNCLEGIKKWIYFGKPSVDEVTNPSMIGLLEEGKVVPSPDTHYFKSGDQWFQKHWLRNDEETIVQRQLFEVSVKMDGSSMTVYHNDYSYGVCSRNFDLKRDPESAFWKAADNANVLEALVRAGRNVAIQGELMGPGVQGNREEFEWHRYFVFNVFDIDQQRYLTPEERSDYLFDLDASVDIVPDPLIDGAYCRYYTITEETTVQELLRIAEGPSFHHPVAEGIVFKSNVPDGPSFKAISNKFLLAEKD